MTTRISKLSLTGKTLHDKTRRLLGSHGRICMAAGAAAIVAGTGAASAVAGPAASAESAARLATIAYTGPATPGGTAETSMFQSLLSPAGNGTTPPHGTAGQQQAGPAWQPKQPYTIYDSVNPAAVPAGQPIATYADGPFAVSPQQVAGHPSVLWIDTNGSSPDAGALDVEPGDATPAGAAQWVQQKLSTHPGSTAVIYTMLSQWQQVKNAISTLPAPAQSHVRYWIADPTGTPHMIPGASATQWYWGSNYDISTANPDL